LNFNSDDFFYLKGEMNAGDSKGKICGGAGESKLGTGIRPFNKTVELCENSFSGSDADDKGQLMV
jgi:hypothetical protein